MRYHYIHRVRLDSGPQQERHKMINTTMNSLTQPYSTPYSNALHRIGRTRLDGIDQLTSCGDLKHNT